MKRLKGLLKDFNRDSGYLHRITKELNEVNLHQFKINYTKMGHAPYGIKNISKAQVINRMSPKHIEEATRWVEVQLLRDFKSPKFEEV